MRARAIILTIAGAALLIFGLAMVASAALDFADNGTVNHSGSFLFIGVPIAILGGFLIYVGPRSAARPDDPH